MAINDRLADLVQEIEELLRNVRLDCHKACLRGTAEDTRRVQNNLKEYQECVADDIERREWSLQSLNQQLKDQRQAARQLKDQLMLLQDALDDREGEVQRLNQQLIDGQVATQARAEEAYKQGKSDGFVDGKRARERPRAPSPHQATTAGEELIIRARAGADEAFAAHDFTTASGGLRQAKRCIELLPADRRRIYDDVRLHYQMAVCEAYVEDMSASKTSLETFLNNSAAFNNCDEMLYVAHVQHLLAQIHVAEDNVPTAVALCQEADRTRRTLLPESSNQRDQSTALMARLYELQGNGEAGSILRNGIVSEADREALRKCYGKLRAIKDQSNATQRPSAATFPATELLPVWNMKSRSATRRTNDRQKASSSQTALAVDLATRDRWLSQLDIQPSPYHMATSLKEALRSGKVDLVRSVLRAERNVPTPALHMVALFGDVQIAKLLLDKGMDVNGTCTVKSAKAGEHTVHGVTPMHCAIGAQHNDMIKLLASRGGSFLMAPASSGHRTSAPPLWLISKRWLDMTCKDDAASVVAVLKTMEESGWNVQAKLNKDGDSMATRAGKELNDRQALKRAVLGFLRS